MKDSKDANKKKLVSVANAATLNADNSLEKRPVKRVDEDELEGLSRLCNTLKQKETRNKKEKFELNVDVKRKYSWQVDKVEKGKDRKKKVALDSIAISQKRREIDKLEIELITIKAELREARENYNQLNNSLRGQNKFDKKYIIARTRLERDPVNYYHKVRINLGNASKNGHANAMKGLKDLAKKDPLQARTLCMQVLEKISPENALLMKTFPSHKEKLFVEIFGPLPAGFKNPEPEMY